MNEKICLYAPPLSKITSYFEMVDLAARYEIPNLETLNVFELAEPDQKAAKELRQYADEKKIRFTCVSVGLNLVGEDRKEKVEKVRQYAHVADILGSPYLHHTLAFEFQNPELVKENYDLYYQRGLEAARNIYDYARTLGVRTLCEDQGYLFNDVEGYGRFLREVGRDIGVVADFGNIMFVDEEIGGFISAFSEKIVNVHIKDYRRTSKEIREKEPGEYYTLHKNYLLDRPFGEGDVRFQEAFSQLKKIGYQGYFAMECPPVGDNQAETFEKNLRYLSGLVKEMGGCV